MGEAMRWHSLGTSTKTRCSPQLPDVQLLCMLNGTASNFTLPAEDPATMPLVDAFLNFGPELDPERGSYYSNLTGFWHGDLQFHNLTSLNASEYQSRWSHLAGSFVAQTNISARWRQIVVYFTHETEESKEIAMVHGKVDLTDPKSSEEIPSQIMIVPKPAAPSSSLHRWNLVDVPLALMQELEDETDNPTGIPTITAPELKLSGVLISQDCGILYEIQNTTGLKSHRLYQKITTYSGFSTIINLTLLALLKRQVWRSSSAVGLSRVSRYAFLTQSLIDAISFVGHITLASWQMAGHRSLCLLPQGWLACFSFMRHNSPFSSAKFKPPKTLSSPGDVNGLSAAPTGNAVQAPTPATNDGPLRQTLDPDVSLPDLRFPHRHNLSLPLFFVGSLYSFIWFAQIYRSARRGRSSGLSTEYLVGTTICRLFFVLYFLGCPKNILDVETRNWIYGVACLMFIQVFIIMLQDTISPTFFLPGRMSNVQTYDYHPPMPLPDPEAPEQTLGDCAICMDAIQVDPALRRRSKSSDGKEEVIGFGLGSGGRRTGGILGVVGASGARKSYSLAPCHHLFHTACLERWLAIKNICPQCRRPLPPL
ncbi:DSC E3 ubiquitin ligase complex subunit 1 [Grifola frondosa]|uniref:RING-type E3 ubiquitin transferase n=1 Tax=Grifola frondosa TaxID=5627 RepID=A0A1C7MPN5_GRIFR|nr:DSC E3 ubiquitin ligase complex subunit 1 [Grifola frondosa]